MPLWIPFWLAAAVLLGALGLLGALALIVRVFDSVRHRSQARRVRREFALDRTQSELRATILDLASQLAVEGHEARKAMIREAFLASGKVPKNLS